MTQHRFPEPDTDYCLEVLQDLIRIKSYSTTDGEKEATEHMTQLLKKEGFDIAETVPFDNGGRQNSLGTWRGSGKGQGLLFNGHVDTNPVGEGWTVDPWGGLIKDGMIFGIGVSNMSESSRKE